MDGKYSTFEAIVPPGNGPPPHIHNREKESLRVLEGEMTFQLGDDRFIASEGTFLNIPVGSPHDVLGRMPAQSQQMRG